jgi:hypothetical protein
MKKKFIITGLAIFLILAILAGLVGKYFSGFNSYTLEIANGIMAAIYFISFVVMNGAATTHNANAFLRGILGGTVFKLFACMIGILSYILVNRTAIHKPTIIVFFVMYLIYTVAETVLSAKATKTGL